MAFVHSSENWEYVVDETEFEEMEISEIDSSLLMSLLEESQVEEAEDERLGCVMRSLEAEINLPSVMNSHSHDSMVEPELVNCEACESHESGVLATHDCLEPSVSYGHEFDWIDMEMASSSPAEDMNNWYMDPCTDEMAGMVEFDDIRDYSYLCYGGSLDDHAYSSLWQESYDSVVMYD